MNVTHSETTEQEWQPQEGQPAYDRRSECTVRVMAIHSFGAFVRPLSGGREQIRKLVDLCQPGGLNS